MNYELNVEIHNHQEILNKKIHKDLYTNVFLGNQ